MTLTREALQPDYSALQAHISHVLAWAPLRQIVPTSFPVLQDLGRCRWGPGPHICGKSGTLMVARSKSSSKGVEILTNSSLAKLILKTLMIIGDCVCQTTFVGMPFLHLNVWNPWSPIPWFPHDTGRPFGSKRSLKSRRYLAHLEESSRNLHFLQ